MRLLSVLLLSACGVAPDVATLPDDQLAPPTIEVSAVIPGQSMNMVVQGLPTGTAITMRVGTNHAPGACDVTVYGECMDVGRPGVEATSVVQRGSAVPGLLVPTTLALGTRVFVQAAGQQSGGGAAGTSPVFERQVGCGDGVMTRGEQCDDGNVLNGDGCSDLCETSPNIELVSAGSQYGFCFGQCAWELDFSGSQVSLTVFDSTQPLARLQNIGALTAVGEARLADALMPLEGIRLLPVYGCPDCVDQGEFHFQLAQNGFVTDHSLDPIAVPSQWELVNELRAELTAALDDCVATPDIVPSALCTPL